MVYTYAHTHSITDTGTGTDEYKHTNADTATSTDIDTSTDTITDADTDTEAVQNTSGACWAASESIGGLSFMVMRVQGRYTRLARRRARRRALHAPQLPWAALHTSR